MKLEIPITEVRQFLSNQYQVDIELKNIEKNKIEAKYIDSVVLIKKEIKNEVILIHYEADGLANLVTKVAHFFLDKKLDNTPIEWDSKNKEVIIDLNKIPELKDFFKFMHISEIHFVKDTIVLEIYVRDMT